MINLLPVEEKQKIRNLYRLRAAIVSLCMFSILLIAMSLGLTPSYLSARIRHQALSLEVSGSQDDGAKKAELLAKAEAANQTVSILLAGRRTRPPSEHIRAILSKKVAGIRIGDIGYTSSTRAESPEDVRILLTLSGVASTRETLLLFAKTLESDKMFSSVDLPISNFVKNQNLPFTINIEITDPNQ